MIKTNQPPQNPGRFTPNQSWSLDFVSVALFDGKKFRALTVVDNFTRECLAIEVGQSLTGEDVVRVLSKVCNHREEHPIRIQADNGPEFISLALDKWAYESGVTLDFSRPGKSTSRPTTPSSNPSTEVSETSASTPTGSCRSKMPEKRSKTGDKTTITSGRTHHWMTPHQCCLPPSFMYLNPSGFSSSDMSNPWEEVRTAITRVRIPRTAKPASNQSLC